MICVHLRFTDLPERRTARPAHRELLSVLHRDGSLHAAGPWADESGALLVFTLDRDGVERLLVSDPYYSTPGVTVESVRDWNVVVGPDRA